ncbi:uncharacterized protein [Littorina saxatilis]|uniref:Uncharacterized protein n=1 Tax=Littorina saxatilis TaxID=31220 RepID=A0AAN9AIU9_9CAEN
MTLLQTATMVSTLLMVTTLPVSAEGGHHSWRYVFPFFPAELDVLLGHLRTTVLRLEEVLDKCKDMAEGEWEGGDKGKEVMRLSADNDDNNGKNMEEKVEKILELRETVSELEDEIEECRFHFWTGQEAD